MPFEAELLRRAHESRARKSVDPNAVLETGHPVRPDGSIGLYFRDNGVFRDITDMTITGWETLETMTT
jgi:hypothetical protein